GHRCREERREVEHADPGQRSGRSPGTRLGQGAEYTVPSVSAASRDCARGVTMGMLDGKVAIVTGAGHGIGRGHAMELAKHGARVLVNDLGGSAHGEGTGTAAEDTVKLIADRGGVAVPNFADVSDYEQSAAMVQQAIDEFGQLDILVNNAGIVRDAAIWNMKVEDWDAVMKVHVRGTWCPSHHASKHWRERAKQGELHARIVNTTSGAGLGGNFGQTNYATGKGAVVGLSLRLTHELYQRGCAGN